MDWGLHIALPATGDYPHSGREPLRETADKVTAKMAQDGIWCQLGGRSGYREFVLASTGFTGLGLWSTFKHMTGLEPLPGDEEDPMFKTLAHIRQLRKAKKYKEAADLVHEALAGVEGHAGKESVQTKLYDELAQVMLDSGELEQAEEIWKMMLARLLKIHGRHDGDPDFIATSIKLADVMAKRGKVVSAEIGFRHCLARQEAIVGEVRDRLMHSGIVQHPGDPEEEYGREYSDPLSLLGICLETFAHFLISTPPPENAPPLTKVLMAKDDGSKEEVEMNPKDYRRDESSRAIFRAVHLSTLLWGPIHSHTIVILNSYAIKCLSCGEYATAAKVLEEVTRRAVMSGEELAHQLPAYYCNYAEALFHAGQRDKGIDVARRALILADAPSFPYNGEECRKEYEDIRAHCRQFVADLERDYKKKKARKGWW